LLIVVKPFGFRTGKSYAYATSSELTLRQVTKTLDGESRPDLHNSVPPFAVLTVDFMEYILTRDLIVATGTARSRLDIAWYLARM
jgi:hypothetical protein